MLQHAPTFQVNNDLMAYSLAEPSSFFRLKVVGKQGAVHIANQDLPRVKIPASRAVRRLGCPKRPLRP